MLGKENISVIILTYNEEIHLDRCLKSAKSIASDIYMVDCFSTDNTAEIAKLNSAVVYLHNWENNYAKQFNWALDNLPIKTEWVLRLDADEYLTDELISEIRKKLQGISNDVSGIEIPLRRVFLNKIIKRGTGKIYLLRLFRYGKAECESRWMDEHIRVLEGKTLRFQHEFADHNLNDLSWWTNKHVGYAIREAVDLLDIEFGILNANKNKSQVKLGEQASSKRQKKIAYSKQPLFLRSFLYFIYRYFFKLGFLEGKEGFLWHFLQGWWYRTLVDAKIFEIKKVCGNDKEKIIDYLLSKYGIDCKNTG